MVRLDRVPPRKDHKLVDIVLLVNPPTASGLETGVLFQPGPSFLVVSLEFLFLARPESAPAEPEGSGVERDCSFGGLLGVLA